jgi:hypothetical protein
MLYEDKDEHNQLERNDAEDIDDNLDDKANW